MVKKLRESNLRVTHTKYYEIHAENSDKAIDLHTVLLDMQPHEVYVRVYAPPNFLCGPKN